MKRIILRIIISIIAVSSTTTSQATSSELKSKTKAPDLVQIKIDTIAIDTNNLVNESTHLTNAILDFSESIKHLASKNINLSSDEKKVLTSAADNISKASLALSKIAVDLPITTEKLSRELPNIIRETQQPIADISNSIQSLGGTVTTIADSLPTALAHTKILVDEASNLILTKMYIFIGFFFLLLVLTIGIVIYYMHRKLVSPLSSKLDNFSTLPKQLTEMTSYMKVTSENLLILQKNTLEHDKERSTSSPNQAPKSGLN